MKWTQIVTTVIAIYGAILSTITLIHQSNKDKINIDVLLSWGFFTYENGTISEEAYIFIEVVNKGHIPVVVNIPYLILPDGTSIVFPNYEGDASFPNELIPGHNCKIWTNANAVMNFLRKKGFSGKIALKVGVKDATGKTTIGSRRQTIKLN